MLDYLFSCLCTCDAPGAEHFQHLRGLMAAHVPQAVHACMSCLHPAKPLSTSPLPTCAAKKLTCTAVLFFPARQHAALLYYWLLIGFYLVSPKLAYNFMQRVELHAYDTYGEG